MQTQSTFQWGTFKVMKYYVFFLSQLQVNHILRCDDVWTFKLQDYHSYVGSLARCCLLLFCHGRISVVSLKDYSF